jgi:hypothetical protein
MESKKVTKNISFSLSWLLGQEEEDEREHPKMLEDKRLWKYLKAHASSL